MLTIPPTMMHGHAPAVSGLNERVWCAGGAVRRWFAGEPQTSDIDIFACDEEAEAAFIEANSLTEHRRTPRVCSFVASPIQLIRVPRFTDARDCIAHFDFALCQFAWDGTLIHTTIEALVSTLRRHLAVVAIQPGYELDSLRRAFKYTLAGYRPCLGTLMQLGAAFQRTGVDLEQQVAISPSGGTRHAIAWD